MMRKQLTVILLSALMVLVAYFPKKFKDFLRLSAIFYGVTFLFAGISFGILLTGTVCSQGIHTI